MLSGGCTEEVCCTEILCSFGVWEGGGRAPIAADRKLDFFKRVNLSLASA